MSPSTSLRLRFHQGLSRSGAAPSYWRIRCETHSENAPRPEEGPRDVSRPSSLPDSLTVRRRRAGGGKLKKSKRMEALAASLASKTRNGNKFAPETASGVVGSSVAVPELYPDPSLQNDSGAMRDSLKSDQVQIPYDASQKTKHFENDPEDLCVLPKPIYIISDCTGDSAAKTVKAALGQFESSIQTHCPSTMIMYRFVSDEKKIEQIVKDAAKENALVVFTLVDPGLVATVKTACAAEYVKYVDLWSDLLDIMESHLDVIRSVLPMNHPNRESRRALDPQYFKRIEAVEYTRKMDDGAHPERWHHADILLLGVSRSGKTPLSIYLGQRGFKVANLPIVKGLAIPPELYEIDQSKVFALTIDAQNLFKIRRSRMGSMGVGRSKSMYADLKGVLEELEYVHRLYRQNPAWPILDVTNMGVEESAARIQRIISERHGLGEQIIYP